MTTEDALLILTAKTAILERLVRLILLDRVMDKSLQPSRIFLAVRILIRVFWWSKTFRRSLTPWTAKYLKGSVNSDRRGCPQCLKSLHFCWGK